MAVIIGSARGDENGRIHGGTAGDQTGREVSTQNWYKHSKGWNVLRAKDAEKAAKIAACMKAACANPHIGYDQYQRNTLYTVAKPLGFDCSKVEDDCETDCSALARVCCAFAGVMTSTAFSTANEVSVLMATGEFEQLTESKYTNSSAYLLAGDILVTRTKGHTAVVLTDGPKAADDSVEASTDPDTNPYTEPRTLLRKGRFGEGVRWTQWHLNRLGYDLGSAGIDGDFGPKTLAAIKAFQTAARLEVDGIVGPLTRAALKAI